MKKLKQVVFLSSLSCCFSQETVILKSGKKVIVNPNGTWTELTESPKKEDSNKIIRPFVSTGKASIARGKCSIYYNPIKWKPKGIEEGGRLTIEHTNGEAFAIIIAERSEYGLDPLKEAVLTNARNADPNAFILTETTKMLNGNPVLYMEIKATIKGIKFHYCGHYYSGEKGSIQVFAWVSENLFEEYKPDFIEFLNGLSLEP